jgi:aspartate-semialdehyde dehydrogenase
MRLALVGITGMVGREMVKIIEKSGFKYNEIYPVASAASVGNKVTINGREETIISLEEALNNKSDIAIFSAGSSVSKIWAPLFAAVGTRVIDNSSAWRMDPEKKLIIPEVNGDALEKSDRIIANPNCSTIQMVMVLAPLHQHYKINRVIVSTYQSVSGTGKKAVEQLENERKGEIGEMAYPYKIDKNCLPHCDDFTENGYTKEEMKLVNETHKILDPAIKVTATAVRVPVDGGHSESVNIEFEKQPDLSDIRTMLSVTPGIKLQDNPDINLYPMPLYSKGKDEVFVGRIRIDESREKAINLWIVADNLRKGAATNTVQIAQLIVEKGWLKQ